MHGNILNKQEIKIIKEQLKGAAWQTMEAESQRARSK